MKACESFNPQEIAVEIVNILAKYKIPINSVNTIFNEVKKELKQQVIDFIED